MTVWTCSSPRRAVTSEKATRVAPSGNGRVSHEAMRRLKPTPDRLKGLRGTNQEIYDTLVLGTTITKTYIQSWTVAR